MANRWTIAPVGICVLSLLLLAGCQSSGRQAPMDLGQSGTSPMPILAHYSGNNDALTAPGAWLVNSDQQFQALGGNRLTGGQAVDFESQSVLVFALGQQNTGGYWAHIAGVQVKGDALFFQGLANRPGADDMVTQALTYPYAAVVLPKVEASALHPEIDSVEGQPRPEN